MIRIAHFALGFALLAPLSACNSTASVDDELARESAETNALIDAAKRQLAAASPNGEDSGKPLPPLPGVDIPAPAANDAGADEEHHHHPQ